MRQVSALDFFVTLSRELQQMGLRPGERELFMGTLQNAHKAGVPPKQQLDTFLLEWAASSAADSVVVGKPCVPPPPQRGAGGGEGHGGESEGEEGEPPLTDLDVYVLREKLVRACGGRAAARVLTPRAQRAATATVKVLSHELKRSAPARGQLSALSVSHSKSVLYGAFAWACRVLNSQKRRFPARAAAARRCSSVIHSPARPASRSGPQHRLSLWTLAGQCPGNRRCGGRGRLRRASGVGQHGLARRKWRGRQPQ